MQDELETISVSLRNGKNDGIREVCSSTVTVTYTLMIVPRREFENIKADKVPNRPGIYFMVGDLREFRPKLYVGQAKKRKNGRGAISRVMEHLSQGRHDFCHWAILLVDKPQNFGPTELDYLENAFTNKAKAVDRVDLQNGNEPPSSEVNPNIRVRLNRLVDQVALFLGTIGIYIFDAPPSGYDVLVQPAEKPVLEPTPCTVDQVEDLQRQEQVISEESAVLADEISDRDNGEPELVLYANMRGVDGQAVLWRLGENQWVIKAGSRIREKVTHEPVASMRKANAARITGTVITEDIVVKSPSAAARLVSGQSTNGLIFWRDAAGKKLKDLFE